LGSSYSLPYCKIVGNGPGPAPALDQLGTPFVRFNLALSEKLLEQEIRICNRKQAGQPDSPFPFLVNSLSFPFVWCEQLQHRLAESAIALERMLSCRPTAGLVTTHAMLQMGGALQLYRMPLRPRMLRAANMPARQPLAAAYHNWMGERRLALQWVKTHETQLEWTGLQLALPLADTSDKPIANPYPALLRCFESSTCTPSDSTADTLRQMATVQPLAWCLHANYAELNALETCFYLDRDSAITPNWWLYHNSLSLSIDRLMLRLMQAQQYLVAQQELG